MKHSILTHETKDDVGVAVMDLKAGAEASAVTLEGKPVCVVRMTQDVPLGHKVALRNVARGKAVLKYGRPIGKAVQTIARGEHVHTHNLKTQRWNA
ncbi:MAG: UxaA family hydrolase [Verrucomicrobia bacterium]|nr:UxaA family hydrolase [Verrucomicrobiota bacterium]